MQADNTGIELKVIMCYIIFSLLEDDIDIFDIN